MDEGPDRTLNARPQIGGIRSSFAPWEDPAARPQSMAEVRAALTSVTSEAKAPAVPVSGSKRLAAFAAFAVIAALAGGGAWYSTRQAVVPMNSLTYTLEARKQGGPVSVASTGETFHFGDKFRLRIESGQTGFLYLINEGPGPNGTRRFWILYPAVSGSAA